MRTLGGGEGAAVIGEGERQGINYFSCLRLKGYTTPLFIVLGDLILKQPIFTERALIDPGCFHNK